MYFRHARFPRVPEPGRSHAHNAKQPRLPVRVSALLWHALATRARGSVEGPIGTALRRRARWIGLSGPDQAEPTFEIPDSRCGHDGWADGRPQLGAEAAREVESGAGARLECSRGPRGTSRPVDRCPRAIGGLGTGRVASPHCHMESHSAMVDRLDRRCFLAKGVIGAAAVGAVHTSLEEKTLAAALEDGAAQSAQPNKPQDRYSPGQLAQRKDRQRVAEPPVHRRQPDRRLGPQPRSHVHVEAVQVL